MARAKSKLEPEVIAPVPTPQQGDKVNYVLKDGSITSGDVDFVHPGHEGRLLNLTIKTKEGSQEIQNTPWRDWDIDDVTPNSWHWQGKA